jgi:ATP-binding cassette, subfamily B, multidrug efflux pump
MLYRLLRDHLRPYRGPVALVVLLQMAQTLAVIYLPTLNADIIDDGVIAGNPHYIIRAGGFMIAIALGQICCSAGVAYVAARIAMAVGADLRLAVFGKVQEFSARDVGRFGTPSLITRTTNDVQQVQMLVLTTLTLLVPAPLLCLGSIVLALGQDVPLSGLLLVVLPVLAIIVSLTISRLRPRYRLVQQRIDQISRVLREQINGVRVIRAFMRERREQARFTDASTGLREVSLGIGRLMAVMFPAVFLVLNLSGVAVVWLGGHLVADGSMRIGALSAFLAYLLQILISVMMATFTSLLVPRAEVGAERIAEVLGTEPGVAAPVRPVRRPSAFGQLEFRDVTFRYPSADAPVLRGIDLRAGPGEIVAVIGGTGSGKTTLLSLVPRLFDTTGGTVLVDGVDVRALDPAVLSRDVGLVPQTSYLFSGTVATTLRYGKPGATDAELWHGLEIAQARDFVERMGGLDAIIGQGGANVSGGQRQRLAIARALVHRSQIYLFDDSFSALDYVTGAALRSALAEETAGATVMIVAQQVTSIRHADRIAVLDEGRVVAVGAHHELVDSCETYRAIALSQMTEQEVA